MKRNILILVPMVSSQLLLSQNGWSLPQGAEVRHGDVSMVESARQLEIQQASQRAIVDYSQFDIQAGEAVRIQQPNAHSILLNRVKAGGGLSEIHGQLQANGQVFLVNPAGILVGEGAQIDVGGLLLTTHSISDESFLSDHLQFTAGAQPAMIQIDGEILVDPGSFVIVLSQSIDLGGDIVAQFGKVSLISADGASVLLQGGHWPDIQVDQATYDAWIHQHGLISAEGGLVEITAASASDLIDRVIFHEGTTDVATRSITQKDGRTFITSGNSTTSASEPETKGVKFSTNDTAGSIHLAGTVDASSDDPDSTIDIRGEAVFVRDQALVKNNGVQEDGGETRVIANYLGVAQGAKFEAKGGAQGDGGFVELSGLKELEINGVVDTTAANGKTGVLYIDPRDITINNAVTTSMTQSGADDVVYTPTGNSATLNNTQLVNSLALNNVIVTTEDGGAGAQLGNLTLANDLNLDQVDGNTLTLRSNNILSINADIEDNGVDGIGGNANIILEATRDIQMALGTRIDAGTGTIAVNVTNGDFTVTELVSDAENTTAITMNVGGSIIDRNGEDVLTGNNILLGGANAVLSMTAGSFIDQLEGRVPVFSAVSTQQDVKGFSQTLAGDIQVSRVDSFASPAAGFTLSTVDGDIRLAGASGENTPGIRIGGSGRLIMNAQGADSNILLNEDIVMNTGRVELTAASGIITMGEANQITSTSGQVALTSAGTQTLGLISTGSTAADAIRLTVTDDEDIVDAHDPDNDTVNLVAPNGGLTLSNVDNFAGLETTIARLISTNLNVEQIVLNETDDLTVQQLIGATTGLTLVAGGQVLVDEIDTAGTVSIQADSINEYYANEADRLSQINQPSITASQVELIANTAIGELSGTDFEVADYLDVDTALLQVQLLAETTADGVNQIAVQQVSNAATGPLVVTDVITPVEAGRARVFLASRNNSLDLRTTNMQLDATDVLGLRVDRAANPASVNILLPELATVQNWNFAGLALQAQTPGTGITTAEIGGPAVLNNLTTSIRQLQWSGNTALQLAFGGSELDMRTTQGNINVSASGAVDIHDLNGDEDAFVTTNGNLAFAGNGTLQLSDTIAASDLTNDNVRAGLIDLSTNAGNILVGVRDVIIRSTNEVDADNAGGLGTVPTDQTAIRVAQNGATGSAQITLGAADTSTLIEAQGGDIYIAAGARAASRDIEERRLFVHDDVRLRALDQPTDIVFNDVQLDEVEFISTSVVEPSLATSATRSATLSSINIAGFTLSPGEEETAEEAVSDIEQSQVPADDPLVIEPSDEENQTRMAVMLETVVPGCESGESLDNSDQCMQKQGFKEFLRSLVLGRGFPDKFKGLPK